MTPERFAALADAYGGDIRRWPEPEQAPAQVYALNHAEAQRVLLEQAALDAALGAWEVPRPTASLAAAIAQNVLERQALWRRIGIWLSGAGAAAALAGGLAAGMSLVTVSPPPRQDADGLYGLHVLGTPLDLAAGPANESGSL